MIECYYKWCKNHSYNHEKDAGPFCNNMECTATGKEIIKFYKLRQEELKK